MPSARGDAVGGRFVRWGAATVVASLVAASSAPARANETSDRAEALFREGREAMKRGDLDEACPKFAESQELDPSAGTLLNLALCEQRKGEGARAWAHFRELVDTLPPSDERAAIARARAETLSQRLPRVTLRLPHDVPAETRVWFDNVELSASDIDVAFVTDPGLHRISVRAPGRVERRYDIKVAEGKSTSLIVAPAQSPDWEAPPLPPSPLLPAPWRRLEFERSAKAKRVQKAAAAESSSSSGYGLIVLGGAAVGVGTIVTWFALEKERISDRTFAVLSTASTLSGIAASVAGIVVLSNNLQKDQRAQRTSTIAPFATWGGGGLTYRTHF
ncbi:MAG: tetratricopeptide repeat protein [Polyangiaceae bacterium]|nr:tetratricopeptide repeat protein [Polyangiaceae bacterium]